MQNEKNFSPAVSVIIPMYNAEKFIRQCLISVLSSKFKDFEIIIVNDCSTDSSVAEVEKLLPHVENRLQIISTNHNSGGAGIPRNFGIDNARGKYITFVDNDDMILPTALGDFFEVAESFNADILHTEKHFIFSGEGNFKREDLEIRVAAPYDLLVDSPTAEPKDLTERINRYVEGRFFWLPWGKLYRREFLIENKIDFPRMRFSEDMVFCFKCLCLAENYIRIPHIGNIRRIRQDSASKDFSMQDWLDVVTKVVRITDEFMKSMEFFQANPDSKFKVLDFFIGQHCNFISKAVHEMPIHKIWELFFDRLEDNLDSRGRKIIEAYLYTKRFFK